MAHLEPAARLDALQEQIQSGIECKKETRMAAYCMGLLGVLDKANKAFNLSGTRANPQIAFHYYYQFIMVVLKELPKHPEYRVNRHQASLNELKAKTAFALTQAEDLRGRLLEQYIAEHEAYTNDAAARALDPIPSFEALEARLAALAMPLVRSTPAAAPGTRNGGGGGGGGGNAAAQPTLAPASAGTNPSGPASTVEEQQLAELTSWADDGSSGGGGGGGSFVGGMASAAGLGAGASIGAGVAGGAAGAGLANANSAAALVNGTIAHGAGIAQQQLVAPTNPLQPAVAAAVPPPAYPYPPSSAGGAQPSQHTPHSHSHSHSQPQPQPQSPQSTHNHTHNHNHGDGGSGGFDPMTGQPLGQHGGGGSFDPMLALNRLQELQNARPQQPLGGGAAAAAGARAESSHMYPALDGGSDGAVSSGAGPAQSAGPSTLRTVTLSPNMITEFLARAQANSDRGIETCGTLLGNERNGTLFIEKLFIPKQTGKQDSCTTHDDMGLLTFAEAHQLVVFGWIHTHPTQTAFLSSVDLHMQYSYQHMLPEALAIVCSVKFQDCQVFRLTEPYGIQTIRNCKVSGFHPHETAGRPLFEQCGHVKYDNSLRYHVVDQR